MTEQQRLNKTESMAHEIGKYCKKNNLSCLVQVKGNDWRQMVFGEQLHRPEHQLELIAANIARIASQHGMLPTDLLPLIQHAITYQTCKAHPDVPGAQKFIDDYERECRRIAP